MASITFRLDPASERALQELTADGTSTSAAIRDALISAARSQVSLTGQLACPISGYV